MASLVHVNNLSQHLQSRIKRGFKGGNGDGTQDPIVRLNGFKAIEILNVLESKVENHGPMHPDGYYKGSFPNSGYGGL